eukprot:gene57390-biopygen41100
MERKITLKPPRVGADGGNDCSFQNAMIAPVPIMKKTLTTLSLVCLLSAAPAAFAQTKEAPVPVRTVAPEYPDELRRDGVSGLVMVKCTIDVQGNVVDLCPAVRTTSRSRDRS